MSLNPNRRRALCQALAGLLLLLLFFVQGPLLRLPLDPALSSFASRRALVPPLLFDLAVALCLALSGLIELPRKRDLAELAPALLYLLLLPLQEIPPLGGPYGGTSGVAEPRLALTPLFGALAMLSLLRFGYAAVRGAGRFTFSPRACAVWASRAACALCLPSLTASLPPDGWVRTLFCVCLLLAAMTLLPHAQAASLPGCCAALIAGLVPLLLSILSFYTTLLQGSMLYSLCALCLTPAALPLYGAVALLGLSGALSRLRQPAA